MLLAGLLLQTKETRKPINKYIWWGSLTQLITGLALTTLKVSEVEPMKIAVKFVILLLLIIICWFYRLKSTGKNILFLLFTLTILEVILAVFWISEPLLPTS